MEDLLADETFLARWLSGDLTEEEAAAFEAHPDRANYERIARSGAQLQPPAYDPEAELARLLQRRKELTATPPAGAARAPLRALRYWPAAAAVLLLLAAGWLMWPGGPAVYRAGTGELVAKRLEDGTMVRLNAGTELAFSMEEVRSAELTGEAFFEVEKSSVPFVVSTASGTVRVLGTSFNVYARDGALRVACVTGRVRVTFSGSADSVDLTKGEGVSWSGKSARVSAPYNPMETMDYLDGRSVFREVPLREVLDEVERQFGLVVKLPPTISGSQTINTGFSHDDTVQDVLKSVLNTLPVGVTFDVKGNKVTVKSSGPE